MRTVPFFRSLAIRWAFFVAGGYFALAVIQVLTLSPMMREAERDILRRHGEELLELSVLRGLANGSARTEVLDHLAAMKGVLRVAAFDAHGVLIEDRREPGGDVEHAVESSWDAPGADGGRLKLWTDGMTLGLDQMGAAMAQTEILLMLVLGGGLAFVFARREVTPLVQVARHAEAIARGEVLPAEAELDRKDEIGLAARSFGEMEAGLRLLSEGLESVERGNFDIPKIGDGPIFERFRKMAESLEWSRDLARANQEVLAVAVQKAEVANEAKGQFLARISHELRTPLNGVIGLADLVLADASESDAHHRDLVEIRECGSRLLRLVNEVLQFARLDSGAVSASPVRMSPAAVFGGVVDRYAERARAGGLELRLELDEARWTGMSDPILLEQAVSCLIDNGLTFTTSGSVRLRARVDATHEQLELTVKDTGPGIPPAQLERIFEAFEQVDGSSSRTHGGVGIGLALCRAVASALEGDLSVESKEGEGAEFRLWVPFRLLQQEAPTRTAPREEAPGRAGLRVLLVDDERINRVVAARHLKALGAEVEVAEDGDEAVRMWERLEPDLILMDCMMPNVDGYEATRRIRQLERDTGRRVPIVAVTANALPGDRQKCLLAGMDDHVPKPVARNILAGVLESWVSAPDSDGQGSST